MIVGGWPRDQVRFVTIAVCVVGLLIGLLLAFGGFFITGIALSVLVCLLMILVGTYFYDVKKGLVVVIEDTVLRPGLTYFTLDPHNAIVFKTSPEVQSVQYGDLEIYYVTVPDDSSPEQLRKLDRHKDGLEHVLEKKIRAALSELPSLDNDSVHRATMNAIEPERYGLVVTDIIIVPNKKQQLPGDLARLESDLRNSGLPEPRIQQIIEQARIEQME